MWCYGCNKLEFSESNNMWQQIFFTDIGPFGNANIKSYLGEFEALISNSSDTLWNRKVYNSKKHHHFMMVLLELCTRKDSNPQPPEPKSGILSSWTTSAFPILDCKYKGLSA